jgi:hypothetical protein
MRCPGGALQDSRPSRPATLSIGNGVLIDITNEPIDAHVQEGDSATFSVSATSNLPLSYQWWTALPGSATFNFLQPTRWGFSGRPGQLLESCVHWGRKGETALWEDPYFNVKKNLPGGANALAEVGATVSHRSMVSIIQGQVTVTMDGIQIFSGTFAVPPVAYLYFTASTGNKYEQTTISELTATLYAP